MKCPIVALYNAYRNIMVVFTHKNNDSAVIYGCVVYDAKPRDISWNLSEMSGDHYFMDRLEDFLFLKSICIDHERNTESKQKLMFKYDTKSDDCMGRYQSAINGLITGFGFKRILKKIS